MGRLNRFWKTLFRNALLSVILTGLFTLATLEAQQLPRVMSESAVRAAGGVQIRGSELKHMLIGNTMYSIFLKGIANAKAGDVIVIYYRDDRTRVVRWPNRQTYQSNIWFEGDNLCVEQRGGTRVGHQCYSAWNLGNVAYNCAMPDGDCLVAFRTLPGNPESL